MRPKIYFNKIDMPNKAKPKRIIIEKLILDEKLFSQNKNKPLFD
jgi:hypothetical protein